jgi:large subunit ribosomal protein L24
VEELIPASSGARPPSKQTWSNEYLTRDPSASNPSIDTVMPLYLSEELSPRFSRAKRTKGWNDRRQVLLRERDEAARAAVEAWEASGRDRVLSDVLSQVGLEGVTVRGRTRKEVREAALAEFDEASQGVRAEVRDARAKGRVWQEGSDGEGYWVEGPKGERLARKQGRKQLRKEKLETRLENLELEPERNVVVPPSARA